VVKIGAARAQAVAGADGRWRAVLPALAGSSVAQTSVTTG